MVYVLDRHLGDELLSRPSARRGWVRRLGLAVGPLLAAALGCNGSVQGGGAASGGNGAQGGSSNANAGTGNTSHLEPQASDARPVTMLGSPIYSRFLRLTNDQWEHSVEDILGLTASTGLADGFLHAVPGTTDFDNNERVVVVNDTVWSDFRDAAEAVAAQVTATDAALQNVVKTTDPTMFIQTFGRRAYRRELTAAEVTTYTDLFTEGSMYSGDQSAFTKGAALVISTMLESPYFLYRTELGDDGQPLSGYEMASKLSLWLRDTTPTDAMLDAAASGAFDTADGAATQAQQMLSDPAAASAMRKFHGQLYKLELYDTITKDNVTGYSTALNAELKEASYQFFDRIFSQDLGVADILTSTVGFAGPLMSAIYGLDASSSGGVTQLDLSGQNRSGYYAQAPFLTLWAINNDPDSIHRGVRINLDTLCADPGQPAANLPPVPALMAGQTNRQRYAALTEGCGAACHGLIINPIGFAFEDFDGLGRQRTLDNGKPVDTTGVYPFAEGVEAFDGSAELMQLIAQGTQAHQCYAKKLVSYAIERDLVESDRPLVEALGDVSLGSGASIKQVMVELVKDDAFRTRVGGAP